MTQQPNLHLELDKDKRIRAELVSRFPESSEDPEALSDTLDGISTLPEAIAAVLRSGREDEAIAEGPLSEQIKRMQARKARLVERAARKRAAALWAMQQANRQQIYAPDFTAFLGMSQAKVIIEDESKIPAVFFRVKREPDKKAIGADLRRGQSVLGASLGNPQPMIVVKDS
jgi:hypothetical protein